VIKIGLTGGIGSGKSTICEVFKVFGIPVYHSDFEAKILSDTHPKIIKQLCELYGNDIYSGKFLDRKKLAAIIFNNKAELEKVNAIIHPVVFDHFKQWAAKHIDSPYIIKEVAILFETGADKMVDKIITVSADLDKRIERVIKRDNVCKEDVEARIKNQMSEQEKINSSDFVIYNNSGPVLAEILGIHEQILKLSKKTI